MARKNIAEVLGARRPTDKLQVSGSKLSSDRVEQALISRDVRDFGSLFAKQKTSSKIGFALVILMVLGGVVWGFISPAGKAGDAKILATKAGARYVVYDGRVHPVTNLSSARLIAATGDSAKNVSEKDLAKYPRGQLMGIPGAPDELSARTDSPATWSVCSQFDTTSALSLTKQDDVSTAVFAGSDALTNDNKVPAGSAVLVSSMAPSDDGNEDEQKTWLLIDGQRMELTSADTSLTSTLRLTESDVENAAPVSHELISAIPPRATFTRPKLDGDGQKSSVSSEYAVGTILTTDGLDAPEHWVVLKDGLQQVGPFAAQMLLSTGSEAMRGLSKATIDAAPHKTSSELAGWPWDVPKVMKSSPTVCYRWDRSGSGPSRGSFTAGTNLPVSGTARDDLAWLLPARNRTLQADAFYTTPGKGWLVAASGDDAKSQTEGQLWWVADTGVRYAIAGDSDTSLDKVLEYLGLGGQQPVRLPWSVLGLIPAGNTLSPSSARVVHATIPIDKAQSRAPEGKELN